MLWFYVKTFELGEGVHGTIGFIFEKAFDALLGACLFVHSFILFGVQVMLCENEVSVSLAR